MAAESSEQRTLYEARRLLGDMGVQTQFTARGDALKGETILHGDQVLRDPGGGPGIERIRFTVQGDGSLRVDDPPGLAGLEGVPPVRKLGSLDALADALRQAMDRRFSGLRSLADRLRAMRLRPTLDAKRMRVEARIELERVGCVVLESDGPRLFARQLVCKGGTTLDFPETPIDLDRFADGTDLELFLADEAERLVPRRRQRPLVSGHHAVPSDDDDDDDDDTELFGEIHAEVRDIVAGLTPPEVGQIWVMDVIVESDDGREVRYRGVGFTGQAFGAPRVLPRPAFEAAYVRSGRTHRMLVQVTHVDADSVGYVRLDAERRPLDGDRKVALVGFLANFTQEPALG